MGLIVPKETREARREINVEAVVSQGHDSKSWKCVFSFPHVPLLMCYTAVIYFQSTLWNLTDLHTGLLHS